MYCNCHNVNIYKYINTICVDNNVDILAGASGKPPPTNLTVTYVSFRSHIRLRRHLFLHSTFYTISGIVSVVHHILRGERRLR